MEPNYEEYIQDEYLPGIHNQSWSPNDEYYVVPGTPGHRYFKLISDMIGDSARAEACTRAGVTKTPRTVFDLFNFQNVLTGAKAGYIGQAAFIDGEWTINANPCVVKCESAGTLTAPSIPTGTVGSPYAGFTVTGSGIDSGSISGSGFPPGLSINSSGVVSGTPTTAGEYEPTITATAPKTGPGTVSPSDRCTITITVRIVIT